MGKPMNVGAAMAILGFLLTCCLCPLTLNFASIIATSSGKPADVFSPYSALWSTRIGNITTTTYVIGAQLLCALLIAFVIFVIGIFSVVQLRRNKI